MAYCATKIFCNGTLTDVNTQCTLRQRTLLCDVVYHMTKCIENCLVILFYYVMYFECVSQTYPGLAVHASQVLVQNLYYLATCSSRELYWLDEIIRLVDSIPVLDVESVRSRFFLYKAKE